MASSGTTPVFSGGSSNDRREDGSDDDEDDDAALASRLRELGVDVPPAFGSSSSAAAAAAPADDGDDGGDDGGQPSPEDVRATLGTVASGLAEQLASITEEMNKIRQELYGDSGIGGIAKELEKLKTESLGGLLDKDALDGALGDLSSSVARATPGGAGREAASPRNDVPAAASGSASSGSSAAAEARRRKGAAGSAGGGAGVSEDRDDNELEDIRRRLLDRRRAKERELRQSSNGAWEKLAMLVLTLVCFSVMFSQVPHGLWDSSTEKEDDSFYF